MKKPSVHTANVFLPGCLGPVRCEVILESDFDAVLAAAPVPPAGDVEVLSVQLLKRVIASGVLAFEGEAPQDLELLEADICAAIKAAPSDLLNHCHLQRALLAEAHVTRLQAEVSALQQRLNIADQQVGDLTAERNGLKAENKLLRHDIASFLETMAKTCELLGIDLESAKTAEGKPSDVLFEHAQRLTAELKIANDPLNIEVHTSNKLGAERDGLRNQCAGIYQQLEICQKQRDQRQAELTKAREVIVGVIRKLGIKGMEEFTGVGYSHPSNNFEEMISNGFLITELEEAVLAHQSAPAAKGGACWSCKQPITIAQWREADGNCPHCEVEIEDAEGLKP